MSKLEQYKREFPVVVAANLATICVWLEDDIGLSEEFICEIMQYIERQLYVTVGLYLMEEKQA